MKHIILILTFFALPIPAFADYRNLVQIVIDDTGGLQDSQDQSNQKTARETMKHFIDLKARDFGRKDFLLILSQYQNVNIWQGDPRKIRKASSIKGLVNHFQSKWGGCSDLLRVFDTILDNMYIHEAREHHIYFFSSLAHTGIPCHNITEEAINSLPDEFFEKIGQIDTQYPDSVSFQFHWIYDFALSEQRKQFITFKRNNDDIEIDVFTEGETRAIFPVK